MTALQADRIASATSLSPADRAWLRMDSPSNLMIVNGVMVFDEPLALEDVRRLVGERLVSIPRFGHRVVPSPAGGRPVWQPDEGFDLARHVTAGRLPAPGDEAALQSVVGEMISNPLDPQRPPWHFHLLEGYKGGSALVGRLHHCIGDGIALMMVLLSLVDPPAAVLEPEREPPRSPEQNPFRRLFSGAQHDARALREAVEKVMPEGMKLLLNPVEAVQRIQPWKKAIAATGAIGKLALRSNDPKTVFKGELGVPKRVAWSRRLPMDEVRELKERFGGTINDLLLTAMTGGLRRYMIERGESPEGVNFRAAVPVNLRPLEKMADLGNEFGLVFLSLPVGIADARRRMAELQLRMQALKRSAESFAVLGFLRFLGRSPAALQRGVVRILSKKATAVMTNVPGPQESLHFGGRRIRELFFWVPQSGGVGLGVSILSYAGYVQLGVVTDAGLVPDPQGIIDGFHQEYEQMLRVGGHNT